MNLWLSGMIRLFDPQIRVLVTARDSAIQARRRSHPDMNIFEDRDFEVIAECDIDIEAQGIAKPLGVRLERARSMNTDPTFIAGLADIAAEALRPATVA